MRAGSKQANVVALPDDEEGLLSAELVARGLLGFVRNGVQTPSITEELRLPRFRSDAFEPYAWPRSGRSASQ
jgi:hypothetical protein